MEHKLSRQPDYAARSVRSPAKWHSITALPRRKRIDRLQAFPAIRSQRSYLLWLLDVWMISKCTWWSPKQLSLKLSFLNSSTARKIPTQSLHWTKISPYISTSTHQPQQTSTWTTQNAWKCITTTLSWSASRNFKLTALWSRCTTLNWFNRKRFTLSARAMEC